MDAKGVEYRYFRLIFKTHESTGIKEINALLEESWEPLRECQISGNYHNDQSVLVLLRRHIVKSDVKLIEVEESFSPS